MDTISRVQMIQSVLVQEEVIEGIYILQSSRLTNPGLQPFMEKEKTVPPATEEKQWSWDEREPLLLGVFDFL